MIRAFFLDFFSVVGGSVGIGLALDAIFLGSDERKKIREFFTRKSEPANFSQVFYSYLGVINSTIFGRYFQHRFLSWRYFRNSAALSLVFLTIIIVIQWAYAPSEFGRIQFSSGQIAVFFICIVLNFVIDWLSIGLTQMLFELSEKVGSITKSIALIVLDFVLTINVFTISYSALIALVLMYFYQPNADSATEIEITKLHRQTAPAIQDGEAIFSQQGWTEYSVSFLDAVVPVYNYVIYASMPNPLSFFADSDSLTLADVRSIAAAQVASPTPSGSLSFEDQGSGVTTLTAHPAFFGLRNSFQYAQTAAFVAVEQMQVEFPASISATPQFATIGDLEVSYLSILGSASLRSPNLMFACEKLVRGKMVWSTENNSGIWKFACHRKAAISPALLLEVFALAHAAQGQSSNYRVPMNSLFMTSFSMTLLVYAFTVFLVLSKFLSASFLGTATRVVNLLERSPFALFGLAAGLVCFAIIL